MSAPDYWSKAKRELSKADPIMKKIIASYQGEAMQRRNDAFYTLIRAIVGQQISVAAADSIFKRLETGIGGMTVENAALKTADELRTFGLTRQKSLYVTDLTRYFIKESPTQAKWDNMTDEEIIKDLVQVKGIGRWTAEMFLMFHLQRPDVLPLGDLALVKAMYKYYNDNQKLETSAMLELSKHWQPWRTVASWYLWRTYDIEAINY
jgi:DNA-3-methyladenine glycosylase II